MVPLAFRVFVNLLEELPTKKAALGYASVSLNLYSVTIRHQGIASISVLYGSEDDRTQTRPQLQGNAQGSFAGFVVGVYRVTLPMSLNTSAKRSTFGPR